MRKIGAIFGIAALAAVVLFPIPAAAFGFHLGRFYFHLPLVGHHHHHHPTRASRNEARTRPNDVSRSGGDSTAAHGRDATEQPDRAARAETNTAALESCIGLTPSLTNLPIDQIRQTVHPTADQDAGLDNLSAASAQASEIIKSSCPASVPLTPIGRMDAAEQRLDATVKAIQMVLSPLERFYEALSDEQRERFNAMNERSCPSVASAATRLGAKTRPTGATTGRSRARPMNQATASGAMMASTTSSSRLITMSGPAPPGGAVPCSSTSRGRASRRPQAASR
jgi:LTXXQ motif family protein